MNRKSLESLIGFALHLRGRLDGTDTQANASRDALELSRLAKRLRYLDMKRALDPTRLLPVGAPYIRYRTAACERARQLLEPYGYWPNHLQHQGLYAVPYGHQASDHDLAVPY